MLLFKLYSAALVGSFTGLGSFGAAQDAPCDASSQACLNVMMANACLAAYIRGGNATEIFRCVNVDNQTIAREEVSCYKPLLSTVPLTKASFVNAMDAPSPLSGNGSPAVTSVSNGKAIGEVWWYISDHGYCGRSPRDSRQAADNDRLQWNRQYSPTIHRTCNNVPGSDLTDLLQEAPSLYWQCEFMDCLTSPVPRCLMSNFESG